MKFENAGSAIQVSTDRNVPGLELREKIIAISQQKK